MRYQYIIVDCKNKKEITHKTKQEAFKDYNNRKDKKHLGIIKHNIITDICEQIG